MQILIRQFTGTSDWVPLSVTYLGFSGTLAAPQDNGSDLEIRVGEDEDSESVLSPGEYFHVQGSDISNIQIKGTGLVLKAFGVTAKGWS